MVFKDGGQGMPRSLNAAHDVPEFVTQRILVDDHINGAIRRLRLLRLDRPPWPVQPNWTIVPDMDAAATILPTGARVFLATGRGSVAAFAGRCDVSFVLRVIEADPGPSPWPHIEYMVARPPFSVEEERATLHRLGIGLLVARNSGGTGGTEKLQAASALKLPVIMVARPKAGQGRIVQTSEDVLDWLGV